MEGLNLAASVLGLRGQCRNPAVAAGEFKVTRSRLGSSFGFRVWGLGFRVSGLGFRV